MLINRKNIHPESLFSLMLLPLNADNDSGFAIFLSD
ncbi:hypothetical protein EL78_5123 [Escherichia coli]|nr:hypothetical protein EL78_5123 [Escherichia coli]